MKKHVIFDPYAELGSNGGLSETDGFVELFCVGFKLQTYLNTCDIAEQRVFMRKAESVFERYRSISPTYNVNPVEGIKLIENIRVGTKSGAFEFAKKLTPHPFLRDEFLKLYP
jgi:hypothetical protein